MYRERTAVCLPDVTTHTACVGGTPTSANSDAFCPNALKIVDDPSNTRDATAFHPAWPLNELPPPLALIQTWGTTAATLSMYNCQKPTKTKSVPTVCMRPPLPC